MLTPLQIADLRRKVQHGQHPIEEPTVALEFVDGPLAGLTVPVEPFSARALYIGCLPGMRHSLQTLEKLAS